MPLVRRGRGWLSLSRSTKAILPPARARPERLPARPPGADCTLSSTSAFQAPQPSQRPVHLGATAPQRSEEHTSELQSLMRISYAVFSVKKKNTTSKYPHCLQATTYTQLHYVY